VKKEPQIFTTVDVQDVPVSDVILDTLEQEELSESLLREHVRQLLVEKKDPDDITDIILTGFMESQDFDDIMDAVFKHLAPNLVRHVLEREINEDMEEFKTGAIEGRFEKRGGWTHEDPSPAEVGPSPASLDYKMGYTWGWNNADAWEGNDLPTDARKIAVETQIEEFEDKITEEMIIAAFQAANKKINPWELLKQAGAAVSGAFKEAGGGRAGVKAAIKKGMPLALSILIGEALDNVIIPMTFFSLTGIPIPPLPIGVGEIINPIVISIVGGTKEEEIADELEWYEDKYGPMPGTVWDPPRVSEAAFREYIRGFLIEQDVLAQGMCFPFAYQKAEEWFEAHFTRGGRGRRPKRHPDLNDKSKFKVVHGTVTDKWKKPPKPVVHGWVEMGDMVFDDQSKITKPDGVPKGVYYDMYQPVPSKEFTAEEAVVNCIKYGGEGPWDEDLYAQLQQRDAWMNENDLNESAVRVYIRQLIMEQEVKFSGILKLMPGAGVISTVASLLSELPPEAIPLSEDRWHVTLVHQSVLKPFRKELKELDKAGMLPPPPTVIIDPKVEHRFGVAPGSEMGRQSWVVWVKNQGDLAAYVNEIMELIGVPPNPEPNRVFHISIANLTGNRGDSVR